MSGFQIPGLGQAKPNETLPPLPADMLAAAASAHGHEDVPEDDTTADATMTEQPTEDTTVSADAMVVDQPGSPPSLTGALEAAIGGLEPATATAAATTEQQPQPEITQPAPLQNDASENPEWEIDSSPCESSSDSSSSESSSDEDDSDNEGYELLGVEETARLLMAETGSDDEGDRGKTGNAAQLRTKNEMQEEAVPRPDVTITPEMKLEEVGIIEHIVDSVALVKAATPGEYQVLDHGSVLCTAERVVVGAVSEIIGNVLQPMYTVIFNSAEEIQQLQLAVGTKLFYTADHATFVFTEPLKNVKGSDASNLYDEEAGDDDMEFSDDEKEAEHKRALKQKKKDKWNKANGKAPASADTQHPLRQEMNVDGGLNYDDDGPYKPLARPSSMASGPSSETYEPTPRSGFRGGRGRGGPARGRSSARGRGGRPAQDGYSLPPQGPPSSSSPSSSAPAPPTAANFGFQAPGWPQGGAIPPPPPGWQPGQQANLNPALFAALMTHMQAAQQGGNVQGGSWTLPPPPPPGQQ